MSRRRISHRAAALPVVVLLLVASAVARLASGTGSAIAREVEEIAPREPAAEACLPDPEIAPILERLAAREAGVVAAENDAAEREQAALAAETRLAERLVELEAAEQALAATMAVTGSAAENDLAQLTSAYQAMKPKDAVPLFEAMDPEFAAGFLSRMRPDAAGAIMAGMDPDLAYAVSAILAGRNARVPTE